MCIADCTVRLRQRLNLEAAFTKTYTYVGGDTCFAAIFFSLNVVLTGFLKKILVFVMIWLDMGVCLKTAMVQDAAVHLDRLRGSPFPQILHHVFSCL